MKTVKQISEQCERIMRLYLLGYGTRKMIERAEDIFFRVYGQAQVY